MLTEDSIMRIISLVIAVLLRVAGLKKAGQYREAQQEIDQAFELLTGLKAGIVKNLDEDSFMRIFIVQDEVDTQRLELVADLFKEEGDIQAGTQRISESLDRYARALNYYLIVAFEIEPDIPKTLEDKIETLVQTLGEANLPPDLQSFLADYRGIK